MGIVVNPETIGGKKCMSFHINPGGGPFHHPSWVSWQVQATSPVEAWGTLEAPAGLQTVQRQAPEAEDQ